MARMTQTEIISSLADSTGCKKTDVKAMFDALAALAAGEVKTNGEFTVPGFGKLKKTHRKAREGRNPATGAVIKIPAKTTVKFSIGKAMNTSPCQGSRLLKWIMCEFQVREKEDCA